LNSEGEEGKEEIVEKRTVGLQSAYVQEPRNFSGEEGEPCINSKELTILYE
jgi:hypothetical protein